MKKLKGQVQASAGEAFSKLKQQEAQQMEDMIGKAWGRALKKNKSLVHIDLSKNHFSEDACRVIGKRAVKNHTIYGLHLAGNCCTVDTQGFVVVDEGQPITEAYLVKVKASLPPPEAKKGKQEPEVQAKKKL